MFGAWLGWSVLAFGVASSLAVSDPETSLAWRSDQSASLARAAALRFDNGSSVADNLAAARLASQALRHGPLEEPALRTLGFIAAEANERERAERLLLLAESITHRDVRTEAWLLTAALRASNYRGAITRADAVLRVSEGNRYMLAQLVQIASDVRAVHPLVRVLSLRPPWRSSFLTLLGADAQGPDTPFMIFEGLKSAGSPPSEAETEPYFARLVAAGLYRPAYERWNVLYAQPALPAEGIYDGRFAGAPGPPPFNWDIATSAELATESDIAGLKGLHVAYSTAGKEEFARQLLMLPTGGYDLSGVVAFDAPPEPGQLGWTITCANDNALLLSARDFGAAAVPLRFSHPFTVPATNCDAQWLVLDGRAGATIQELNAWYANLRVVRTGPAAATSR